MLTLQNNAEARLDLPGMRTSGPTAQQATAKFDLDVLVGETFDAEGAPAGLQGSVGGAADLFDLSSVDRLSTYWTRALETLVGAPACGSAR